MVILKKKLVKNILLLLIFILFFFTFYYEYKNRDDHVYYKVINLNSHKIYGTSLEDKNNIKYKFLDNENLNILFQIFGYEKLANTYKKILEDSKRQSYFCDVNKSKNCIYPIKDKNTCFISTIYNDNLKMSILRYEEAIEVIFVSGDNYQGKFDVCISQFLNFTKELIQKKIESLKKENSNFRNESYENKFLELNFSIYDLKNYYQEVTNKSIIENDFSIIFLNNLDYYLSQVDLKSLKTLIKTEKKTLIQNFKFSFLIMILAVYFLILIYKKEYNLF